MAGDYRFARKRRRYSDDLMEIEEDGMGVEIDYETEPSSKRIHAHDLPGGSAFEGYRCDSSWSSYDSMASPPAWSSDAVGAPGSPFLVASGSPGWPRRRYSGSGSSTVPHALLSPACSPGVEELERETMSGDWPPWATAMDSGAAAAAAAAAGPSGRFELGRRRHISRQGLEDRLEPLMVELDGFEFS
eukprot:PLAT10733.2.p2 GENE.PLAT10733.2~~PLAT10733.2.p2  ORF type:complete len:188 (+),score=51.20 PLAT10733.2:208-771(+)